MGVMSLRNLNLFLLIMNINFLSARKTLLCASMAACCFLSGFADKLTGTPIGTTEGFNYEQGGVVYNIQGLAFDGNLNTYFATNARSYTWVGLDLGEPYVIDRVGWAPRNDGVGPKRVQLGVIQGANSFDFLDAVPLYIITEQGVIGKMSYADINCSKGFRYVRFVSTGDARCNIAELEFYGTKGEGDDSNLFQVTNLPTVCINTLNAQEPYDKEHDIKANIIIINEGRAYVDQPGTVRERGNASREFPKKPWRIKFDKKQRVLPDAPAEAKKWTLINNYGDKTLMRNLLAFEIARRLGMEYVPYGHAVDVILNGEYKGCYQLCDQVEVNKKRVAITEMEPEDISGDALTGGYLIEVDAYADQEPANEWFTSRQLGIPVTIKSPDDGGTTRQYNYIRDYFNTLESKVTSGNISSSDASNYRNILDIESFLQHFLTGELSGNTDTYWSTYMYKDRGSDMIFTGPVWDFDIAFDNDYRTYPIHDRVGSWTYMSLSSISSAANGMKNFVSRIINNDTRTKDDIKRIWSIARNDKNLSYDGMADFIDELCNELNDSQRLNFLRWPIMNEYVHMNPAVSGSYTAEVDRVKNYLNNRFKDLDKLTKYDPTVSGVNSIYSSEDHEELRLIIDGQIVASRDGSLIEAYSIDGRKVNDAAEEITLSPGIYIIRSGNRVAKIRI